MKIGIMSDSHDHVVNIRKSIGIFQDRRVDFVLHLGDYVNPASVRAFKSIRLVGIFGNNDGDKFRLINAFHEVGGEMKGDFCEIAMDGLKCACYHGTEPELTNALIESGTYDAVFYGHTHECENRKVRNTLVLNPGTAHGFWEKATIVIFDTQSRSPEFIEL